MEYKDPKGSATITTSNGILYFCTGKAAAHHFMEALHSCIPSEPAVRSADGVKGVLGAVGAISGLVGLFASNDEGNDSGRLLSVQIKNNSDSLVLPFGVYAGNSSEPSVDYQSIHQSPLSVIFPGESSKLLVRGGRENESGFWNNDYQVLRFAVRGPNNKQWVDVKCHFEIIYAESTKRAFGLRKISIDDKEHNTNLSAYSGLGSKWKFRNDFCTYEFVANDNNEYSSFTIGTQAVIVGNSIDSTLNLTIAPIRPARI